MRPCFACLASECVRHSFPQLSPLRLLPWFGFSPLQPPGCTLPHGQWALLDADMLELIDRSACLVEPVLVGGAFLLFLRACATRTAHVQRRAKALLANTPIARPCVRSCAPPICSRRAAPVASPRLAVMSTCPQSCDPCCLL